MQKNDLGFVGISINLVIKVLQKRHGLVYYAIDMEKRQKPRLHTDWVDYHAKDIVYRLQKAGYQTYLVGGCVRDLLAGIHPKDYDIATSAEPEEVREHIRGSYLIGRRFRLVLVRRGEKQFEVATFRRTASTEEMSEAEGETPKSIDNFFGTPEEDAVRRDFTVNALFYDPVKDELIDYINGQEDVDNGLIRIIGDADTRLKEDPIRILRAIRLSHKLKFTIEPTLRRAIERNADELNRAIMPRKREEYLKILRLPDPALAFHEMYDLGLLKILLPSLHAIFEEPQKREVLEWYLHRTSQWAHGQTDPVHLLAPLFMALAEIYVWENLTHLEEQIEHIFRDEMGVFKAEHAALFHSLELHATLKNLDRHLRKGARRQQAFLGRENLPLALKMAEIAFHLNPAELLYWKEQLKR